MKIKLYMQEDPSFCHSLLVEDDRITESWITLYIRLPRQDAEVREKQAAKWVGKSGAHGLLDEAGYSLYGSWDTRMEYEDHVTKRDEGRW